MTKSHRRITIHLLTLCFLLLPSIVWSGEASFAEQEAAGNFVPLVGIPFIEGDTVATFGDYVNAFYFAAISIAAFLAVVRIVFAGVKYMLSGVVTDKQVAKKDIRSALFGLLIVVGAVLILNTINTNLTNVSLFADAPVPGMTGDPGRVATVDPVEIGDESTASDTTFDTFSEQCRLSGGQPSIVTTTETISGRKYVCGQSTDVDSTAFATLLNENQSLTPAARAAYLTDFTRMTNNANITDTDLSELIAGDLNDYMSANYTYTDDIQPLQAQYIAEGMTSEDAAIAAAAELLEEDIIFIRNNNSGNQQDKEELCSAVNGQYVSTETSSGFYMICVN